MFRSGKPLLSIILLLFLIPPVWAGGGERSRFVHTAGGEVAAGEREIRLRGIAMGNGVWEEEQTPEILYANHSADDLLAIADMGMNVVRFYMNYRTFEEESDPYVYKQTGWDWIDDNVEWAGEAGVYLILNMTVPQGGFQSGGGGLDLWEIPENQERFKALWMAIAARYANETVIAGYDLLNEPTTSQSIEQWMELAQATIDSIRLVDQNHMIVHECLYGVWGDWETDWNDPENCVFLVDDPNVLYDFHFYAPLDYTHWFEHEGLCSYPDTGVIYLPADAEWSGCTCGNPVVPPGNSDWSLYAGDLFPANDTLLIAASPVFAGADNPGVVHFDDFVVRERDPAGGGAVDIMAVDIVSGAGWDEWSLDGEGILEVDSSEGHNDQVSLSVSGPLQGAGWAGWGRLFPVKPFRSYSISGWMKGEGVGPGAVNLMRLDFYRSPSGSPAMRRDREYLEYELSRWSEYFTERGLPVNIGEYGADNELFDGYGGLFWVEDAVDLMEGMDFHFTYHLYENLATLPQLVEWFQDHAAQTGVEQVEGGPAPRSVALHTNIPNPFNPVTTIRYDLPAPAPVYLAVYDVSGRLVQTLVDEPGLAAGRHEITWEGRNSRGGEARSGAYFCRIKTGDKSLTRKMTLIR